MSIAIVAGALGNKPFNGGFAWVPLSYALGLRRLGFEVYMYEDIGPNGDRAFLHEVLAQFGLESLPREATAYAEILVNLSGHATDERLVSGPHLSAYIDTDPGFTQIWHRNGLLHASIEAHTHHFSVGVNLGTERSLVPDDGISWRPLAPPVVLDEWPPMTTEPGELRFTTVATWRCPSGLVSLDGNTYLPSKLHEFRRMVRLPSRVERARFEIALDIEPADSADRDQLIGAGWKIVDPRAVAREPRAFRTYVGGSSAEFSTVQGVYAAARTGWISDRSVRYLASGRPVLVQDTCVPRRIAGGEGMLTFTSLAEAQSAVERIADDYTAHSAAARDIAERFFDSDRVLGEMLDQMGARP